MKKIKGHLIRVGLMIGFLAFMWVLSLIPAWLLNSIGGICLALAILVMGYLLMYYKMACRVGCFLLMIGLAFAVSARSLEDCDEYDKSSVDEGNYCRYNVLADEVGSSLCGYMKTFNPSQAKTGQDSIRLQENVNNASKLVQFYNDLKEPYQRSLSSGCKVVTKEDKDKSPAERLKILRSNNSPLCCAWAMQSEFQIYTSQNGERQIETVPMMMADEKLQCWPCDVVYLLITLANTMSYRSAPTMAGVAMFFLKWMFIFWIVFKIGCLFLNRNYDGKPYGGKQFIKDLFARVLCVALAAIILADTAAQMGDTTVTNSTRINTVREKTILDDVYQRVANPIFEGIAAVGIEMSQALLRGEASFYGRVAQQADVYGAAMGKVDYCTPKTCSDNSGGCILGNNPMYQYITQGGPTREYTMDVTSQGRVIADDTTRNLLCLTQLAYQGLAPISAAGSIITSHAIKNAWALPFPLPGSLPIVPQLFYGLILMLICWLLGVAVAFRIIDIMVRVAMMVMLCPIFIALAVFPATRDKAKTAVVFFISAVMGFIEVALAVAMTVPVFYHAIASEGKEDALIDAMVAPSTSQYVPNLYAQFSDKGMKFFLFISVVGWMAFKLLECVCKFFEEVFNLQNVGQMGAGKGGSMAGAAESIRESIGENYDVFKGAQEKSGGFAQGFSQKLQRTRAGRGLQKAGAKTGSLYGGAKAAGSRFFGDVKKMFNENKTVQGAKNLAHKSGQAMDKASTAVGSGMQKGGGNLAKSGARMSAQGFGLGSIVGIPMMAAGAAMWVGGTAAKATGKIAKGAARGAGKVLKGAGSFAKQQFKQGVHDFFHPNE